MPGVSLRREGRAASAADSLALTLLCSEEPGQGLALAPAGARGPSLLLSPSWAALLLSQEGTSSKQGPVTASGSMEPAAV